MRVPHEAEGQRVLIQKCREVTVDGQTHVSELYAEGLVDVDGHMRLIACVGKIIRKSSRKSESSNENSAAA